jgi:prepilin-type N-terminal cleavage/methylation domain-containing protein
VDRHQQADILIRFSMVRKSGKITVFIERLRRLVVAFKGYTLIEMLTVTLIIVILASIVIPASRAVNRRNYENQAVMKLERIATAEKRYYSEYGTFGYFGELVNHGDIPQGYSTRFYYNPLLWGESILPYIDKYSLHFTIPSTPNSAFFKIDAIPEKNRLNLQTFNINMFLDGPTPDRFMQLPPVRKGLDENGEPVVTY